MGRKLKRVNMEAMARGQANALGRGLDENTVPVGCHGRDSQECRLLRDRMK